MTMATLTTPTMADSALAGPLYIDTQHDDMVHDAQMDYYGSKLATCSSDRTIKVYNVSETAYEISATLQGHEGPVWQVSWAHPKFGVLLASCSLDGSVLIHREGRPREWSLLHAARHVHDSSVNGVAFAPHEYGLLLAAASADGRVSILQHQPDQTWTVEYLADCPMGVNAVSWAPYGAYLDLSTNNGEGVVDSPRLVTAGCDHQIRFWKRQEEDSSWVQIPDAVASFSSSSSSTVAHGDWVRDVAWAPCLVPHHNTVASAAEDGTVIIWQQSERDGPFVPTLLHTYDVPVWRVSWSMTGHLLAVSAGNDQVTLWKAALDGTWTQVAAVEDTAAPAAAATTTSSG